MALFFIGKAIRFMEEDLLLAQSEIQGVYLDKQPIPLWRFKIDFLERQPNLNR
jgi:hypothetical protein